MKGRHSTLNNQKGFTLIEIIAVLVLLGILAAVAVPRYMDMQADAQRRAIEGALAAASSNVTLAYSRYLLTNSAAPTAITANQWTGGGTAVAIETGLGDFTAGYAFATPNVTITIATGPAWFAASTAPKTKAFSIQP